MKIQTIHARQILDSRGNPTIECDVILENGVWGRAAVPSGASTGSGEALELRDGDPANFGGKSVLKAIENVNSKIQGVLQNVEASDQANVDKIMLDLDGTENKTNLGANAILAVSLAVAKASANAENLPLYKYIAKISGTTELSLPLPMMNIMNGGEHANFATDIQEFMIIPIGAPTINDAVRWGTDIFHALAKILKEKGYATTVGDEGGYAPKVAGGNAEPFELISQAVAAAGLVLGADVKLAIDAAASEFYSEDGTYRFDGQQLTADQLIAWYEQKQTQYPIISIEDGLAENDWANWTKFVTQVGDKTQLVGDDLLVTNTRLLQKAIDEKAANSILIKPNQIGSLTETINAVKLAQANNFTTIMSHRSGETEDTTIAHLAVGLNCGQIKTGSLSRSERIAKYNELLRIAEQNPNLQLAKPFQ